MGKNAHSWNEVACFFGVNSVVILGSELERFVSTHEAPANVDAQIKVADEQDIDPSDMPCELDAANMAYRAVFKGYGKSDTFKNKLIEYLNKEHPGFKKTQVARIATIANPDKTTGRKKNIKELSGY